MRELSDGTKQTVRIGRENMIPISICIIAKNEEKNIETCLRSLYKHPFEIILVDTGSTDRTKELAKKYATTILDLPWQDDYSAARNFAIEAASNDFVLVIDCDEYIDSLNFSALQECIAKYPSAIGMIGRTNVAGKSDVPFEERIERLFNKNLYHYEGSIHEQLVKNDGSRIYTYEAPLCVVHTGSNHVPTDQGSMIQKQISQLSAAIVRDPKNAKLYYELGAIYMNQEEYETAYSYLDKGFNLPIDEKEPYVAHMIILYGYSLIHTGRIEKAMALKNVYDLFKKNADFLYLMGKIYFKARLYDEALMEFLRATTTPKHFTQGTNSYLAFYEIACIYEILDQLPEAVAYLKKAGDYAPAVSKLQELSNPS